jgi:hypothetical protein
MDARVRDRRRYDRCEDEAAWSEPKARRTVAVHNLASFAYPMITDIPEMWINQR